MTHKEKVFASVSVLLAISFALLVAEIALRILEAFGRDEMILDYKDTWRELEDHIGQGGWLLENFDAYVTDGYGGKVRWRNNSQGFRADVEYSETPAPGVLRILSLGDSFTAGYRVGQEETFSYRLEDLNPNAEPLERRLPPQTWNQADLESGRKYFKQGNSACVAMRLRL